LPLESGRQSKGSQTRTHTVCVCVCDEQHGETHEWRRSSNVAAIVTSLVFAPSVCVERSIGLCIQSAAELMLGETLLRGIVKHGADVNDRLARWVAWLSAVSVWCKWITLLCRMGHVQCYCSDVWLEVFCFPFW